MTAPAEVGPWLVEAFGVDRWLMLLGIKGRAESAHRP